MGVSASRLVPVPLTPREFERLVADAIDALPDEFLDGLDNVAFVIEPTAPRDPDLLGLYEGVPVTERGFDEYLPDRIVVYRDAHLRLARDVEDLEQLVRETVFHEVGHYYGIDDDRLDELGWS